MSKDTICQSVKSQWWPVIPSCHQAEWEKEVRRKADIHAQIIKSCFLPWQNRLPWKEMTVLVSLQLIGPNMFVKSSRSHVEDRRDEGKAAGQDQTRHVLPTDTFSLHQPPFSKKNIQRKSTIMQKNTLFLCRTGLQSSKGLRLISILKTNFHSSEGEGWI